MPTPAPLAERPIVALHAGADAEAGTALPAVGSVPGELGRAWVDRLAAHECPAITARRARRAERFAVDQDPVVWVRARGANVEDPDGNRYVDLTGGFGVASAGHGNPAVRAAAHEQIDRLVHGLGDAFPSDARIALAEELAAALPSPLEQVIFGSAGSEAVEAAVKTACVGTGRSRVVAFEGGYHGLALGALPHSHYRAEFRQPFSAVTGAHVVFLPWGGRGRALREAVAGAAAVLVEPLQGRGGMRPAPDGWFAELGEVTRAAGARLVFDEIYTGMGRAGELVLAGTDAVDGVVPDLLCLGKGLAGGFVLSACVGSADAMAGWGPSRGEALHTSTFLGHPVGCAAARAVLRLLGDGLLERGRALGRLMEEGLQALRGERPDVFVELRGRGAMRGLRVAPGVNAFGLCRALLQRGYLLLPCGLDGDVLSFTPPLTTTAAQWQGALDALGEVA